MSQSAGTSTSPRTLWSHVARLRYPAFRLSVSHEYSSERFTINAASQSIWLSHQWQPLNRKSHVNTHIKCSRAKSILVLTFFFARSATPYLRPFFHPVWHTHVVFVCVCTCLCVSVWDWIPSETVFCNTILYIVYTFHVLIWWNIRLYFLFPRVRFRGASFVSNFTRFTAPPLYNRSSYIYSTVFIRADFSKIYSAIVAANAVTHIHAFILFYFFVLTFLVQLSVTVATKTSKE